MQTIHTTLRPAPLPHIRAGGRLFRWWQGVQRRRRIRRTARVLEGLSDMTLKDIGLHRSEIPSAARSASQYGRRWR